MNDAPWGREAPSNLQAEQSLLGALLSNNKALDRCAFLRPEHFADGINGKVFAAILRRINAGRLADAVSLRDDFANTGTLDDAGGTAYLAQLLGAMVGIINAGEYATAIREAWARRELIDTGETLVNLAYGDREPDAASIAAGAVDRLDAIAAGAATIKAGVTLDEAMEDAIRAMEEARDREGPAGISTGFGNIDLRLGGLEPGTVTVLAGRPGMGKSAMGHQIAINAARAGVGVLEISLEMSARELGRRALATVSGVPVASMKRGDVTVDQASSLVKARKELAGLPLTIEDGAGLTATMIAARARAAKRKGLGLVMIDHLHIVRPDDVDMKAGPTWAIGRISGAMKRLAKDCGVPVLLLAQLNRGVEGRDDKRPGLADLRQSGDIEQDADAVGFCYRAEYYLANEPEARETEAPAKLDERRRDWSERKAAAAGKAEVIWAKVRDGEPGTDAFRFDGPTTTFTEEPND